MAANQENELLFEVNLLFPEDKNAIEAFTQIIKFYEILNEFDKTIVRNVGHNFISEYGLEDIKFSSIKTKLLQILKIIPDEV